MGGASVTLLHHEELQSLLSREKPLEERLIVTPLLDEKQVGEASIDLRLGTEFLLLRRTRQAGVDMAAANFEAQIRDLYDRIVVPFGEGLWLHPQQFALGATLEFVRLPATHGAYVLSRSSWGRLGLLVATAVMVQPCFSGSLTLELVNAGDSPIRLYPGTAIAQLAVHSLPGGTKFVRDDPNYVAPTGPQPAKLTKDREALRRVKQLGGRLARVEGESPTSSG
jgi:dCTP deaminase